MPWHFYILVMMLSKVIGETLAEIITSPKVNCEPRFTTRKLLRESVIVPQYKTQSIPLACLVPNEK